MKKPFIYLVIAMLLLSFIPYQPNIVVAEGNLQDAEDYQEEEGIVLAKVKGEDVEFFEDLDLKEPSLLIPDDSEVTILTPIVDEEELGEEFSNDEENEYTLIRYEFVEEIEELNEEKEVVVEGYVYNEALFTVEEAEEYRKVREETEQESEEESDSEKAEEDKSVEEDVAEEENNAAEEENTEVEQEEVNDDADNQDGKFKEDNNSDVTNDEDEVQEENSTEAEKDIKKEEQKVNGIQRNTFAATNTYVELKNGMRDQRVVQLKKDLSKLGFPVPGNGTTLYGKETEKQVKAFQKYYGLAQTGTLNQTTDVKISNNANSPLQNGKRDTKTVQLKKDLALLGFPVPGNGTTLYGAETEKQVKAFQKQHKLVINGIADEVTLGEIEKLKMDSSGTFKEIKNGMRDQRVKQLKKDLAKLGFPVPGNGTTLYGKETEKQVRAFQSYYGITVTGTFNVSTDEKIKGILATPLQNGKRHSQTVQLKKDLAFLNFKVPGNGTTLYGAETEKQVRAFQSKRNLVVNGIADVITLKEIDKAKTEPLRNGMRREDVIQLKKDLARLGFPVPGNGTNLYGKETEKQVKAFQQKFSLVVDGIAGNATFQKIASELAKLPGGSTPPVNKTEYTDYNLTFAEAVSIQLGQTPQTDKYKNDPAYVSVDYINLKGKGEIKGGNINVRTSPDRSASIAYKLTGGTSINVLGEVKGGLFQDTNIWYEISINNKKYYVHSNYAQINEGVTTATLNVRAGKSTTSHIFGQLSTGSKVTIKNQSGSWYEIDYKEWRLPTRSDIESEMNPDKDIFQHLRVDSPAGEVNASDLNPILIGKGTLAGQGQAFINGAKNANINVAYLIAHARLETGNGTSKLAKGVEVGVDKNNKITVVTSSNRSSLTKIKKVYNMFGIDAIDLDPINRGAIKAYKEGWDSPKEAIESGAEWVREQYIDNAYNQNTIYKMRWNPSMKNNAWKQYATDIGWAEKQTSMIKQVYNRIENPNYHYDIARYK